MRRAFLLLLVIGCRLDPDGDSGQIAGLPAFDDPLDDTEVHLLATAIPPAQEGPVLMELTPSLEPIWEWEGNGAGAMGARREEDGRTTYARVALPPAYSSSVEQIDADEQTVWRHEDLFFAGVGFSHGVVRTPAGRYIALDTSGGDLVAFDEDGEIDWIWPVGEELTPNGIALHSDADGLVHLGVTALRRNEALDTVLHLTLPDEDVIPQELVRAELGSTDAPVWPHGPRFDAEGRLSYCASTSGQVVGLDDNGEETYRIPEAGRAALTFPRDAAFLPDGSLVVSDAGLQLLRVADPFGDFEIVGAFSMPGTFSVGPVQCGQGGGLPCMGSD